MTKALAFGQNYSSEGGHRPVRRPGTRGGVLVTVGVCLPGRMPSSNPGPSASSSVTPIGSAITRIGIGKQFNCDWRVK